MYHVVILTILCLLTGCASHKEISQEDPFEYFNRDAERFNDKFVNKIIIKPVTTIYEEVVPKPLQRGVTNFIENLLMPVTLACNLLTFKGHLFLHNFVRFSMNTLFGGAGIFDVAKEAGLEPKKTDINETIKYHGGSPGFYIVIPFLGSTCARQLTGLGIEIFAYPLYKKSWFTITDYFETMRHYKDLDFSIEIDPYIAKRNMYLSYQKDNKENEKK